MVAIKIIISFLIDEITCSMYIIIMMIIHNLIIELVRIGLLQENLVESLVDHPEDLIHHGVVLVEVLEEADEVAEVEGVEILLTVSYLFPMIISKILLFINN